MPSLRLLRNASVAAAVVAATGCATMFDRSPRRILVASTPSGAEVFVDGDRVGTTPTSVRSDAGSIGLESGPLAQRVRLSREASPWLWADIPASLLTGFLGFGLGHRLCDECDLRPKMIPGVFTSLLPIIVDLVTGRAYRYPSRVHVTLAPPIDNFLGLGRFGQSRSQQPRRPVQPDGDVLLGDAQALGNLSVRPFFEVSPPRHLAERGRQRRPSGRGPYSLREAQQ